MRLCPNCGHEVADNNTRCPQCGVELNVAWPPPPEGTVAPPLPPMRLLTGNVTGDFVLGFMISLLSLAVFGVGLLAMPILYFAQQANQNRYPVLLRGIGWGALAGWALVLGAVSWCFYSVFHADHL